MVVVYILNVELFDLSGCIVVDDVFVRRVAGGRRR